MYVHTRFDLHAFLTSLERDRITHAYVAPPVMLALAKHPAVDGLDLSHLRRVICAAAPLDAGVQAAVADRLGVEIGQAYGMTELSSASHIHADGGTSRSRAWGVCFRRRRHAWSIPIPGRTWRRANRARCGSVDHRS